MCIYNHCVEDLQKNLVFIVETQDFCKIITVKPMSHLAYVVTHESEESKGEAVKFSEANKVLFSEISYDLSGAKRSSAQGLIDFVK